MADLKQLLRQSRTNNIRLSITGLLLFGSGSYLQVLEGEQGVVEQLYEVIRNDRRHFGVVTLSSGSIQTRVFQDWTMGFQELPKQDFDRLMGYTDPYRAKFQAAHPPEVEEGMRRLLRSFVVSAGSQF